MLNLMNYGEAMTLRKILKDWIIGLSNLSTKDTKSCYTGFGSNEAKRFKTTRYGFLTVENISTKSL